MSRADTQHSRRKKKRTANQPRVVWDRQQRKRRRELGQNFLKHQETANKIVEEAGVTDQDLVVEFGAGSGMLTRSLANKARKVVAVEYDPFWASRLKQSFAANGHVEIIAADALSVRLPEESFRVVANVPFHISTAILHRLLDDPRQSPQQVHLLVQKQLARKHARATSTTLKTLTWSPWWRFATGCQVPARAFEPEPEVDACLLIAAQRDPPLVADQHQELFRALVRAAFNGRGNLVSKALRPFVTKKQIRRLAHDNGFSTDSFPTRLTVHQWVSVFEFMIRAAPKNRWPMPPDQARAARSEVAL